MVTTNNTNNTDNLEEEEKDAEVEEKVSEKQKGNINRNEELKIEISITQWTIDHPLDNATLQVAEEEVADLQ